MPITKEEEKLTSETISMLQEHASEIDKPVRISPKRMDAFHKASRLRMTVNINGRAIQLVEDRHAPKLEEAITEASKQELPQLDMERGPACEACGVRTILIGEPGTSREAICVRCKRKHSMQEKTQNGALPSDNPEEPKDYPDIVLASERAREEKVH